MIPFVTFAHGQTSTNSFGLQRRTSAGMRLEVGARAGFEVFFGFIGIPELALSATVGLQFESLQEQQRRSGGLTQSDTTLRFTTTVQNNPWYIFAGNVAARYYF